MNKKELEENMSKCSYGTKKYFEYNLIEMVNSIYCYDNYGNDYDKYFNDKYIKNYYLDKSYCNGKGRLTKEVVEEVVKNRVDYLIYEILEKEENNNIDNLISKIKSNYLKRKEVK